MQIKHKKTALKPDTGDSSMVQPSDWNSDHEWTGPVIIDADTSYNILVDGTGSYADIPSCFDDINKFIVGNQSKITVNLGIGIHDISREISFCNRYTDLVQICGSEPLGPFTSASVTVSGSAGAWVNVITPNEGIDTSIVVPGMYVMVYATTLSSYPGRIWGCHKITAVTASTITILNTNQSPQGPSGATGLSFYIFTSVIKSSLLGVHGVHVHGGASMGNANENFAALKNVVIEGPSLATQLGFGIYINQASSMYIGDTVLGYSKVGVSGMGHNVWVSENSFLDTRNRYLTSSSGGEATITASDGGYILITAGAICTGARVNPTSIGLCATNRGTINSTGMILAGNRFSAYAQYNSWIRKNAPAFEEWVTSQSTPAINVTPTHASLNMGYVSTT